MTIENLLTFNIVLLTAILSPGPGFLHSMTTSLSAGRPAGLAAGLGLGTMAAGWTLLAVLGLEAAMQAVPDLYLGIRIAGGLYLLWIAVGLWRDVGEMSIGSRAQVPAGSMAVMRFFWSGLMINMLNPKSIIFAASVIVMIFPPDISLAEMLIVPLNHLFIEYTVYFGFAFVFSHASFRQAYLVRRGLFNRFAAVIMAGLALRMLVMG